MVYYADGNGRDSFIYSRSKGRYDKELTSYEKIDSYNSFWGKKDQRAQLIEKGVLERPTPESFPSSKALRLYQFEKESEKDTTVFFKKANEQLFEKSSIFPTQAISKEELTFREETLPSVPIRIPGYSGHIPATHEVVGASVHSDRYLEETSTNQIEFQKTGGYLSTQRLSQQQIEKQFEEKKQSTGRFNRSTVQNVQTNQEEQNLQQRDERNLHPVKFVRKPQVEVPFTHHVSGFGGHQPQSIHTLKTYQDKSKSVQLESTL